MIEIIEYQNQHQADFRALNIAWLDHYHLTESHDLMVLDDPQGTILQPGGCIFLATEKGAVVGSAALMPTEPGEFELAKMAVAAHAQGRGISKLLLQRCLQQARVLGARRVTLYSNHQLEKALQLYHSFGFKDIPLGDSPFETADVHMEYRLE